MNKYHKQHKQQPIPRGQTYKPLQSPQQPTRSSRQTRPSMTYHLWRFADPQTIDALAKTWIQNMSTESARTYLVALFFLTVLFGMLAWGLDLGPSYNFAEYIREAVTIKHGLSGGQWARFFVLLGALSPTLLEFFSVGFALQGAIALDIMIKIAVLFDAITDAPGAFQWAGVVMAYFIDTSTAIGSITTLIASAIILFFATIAVETVFLSFLLAFLRTLKRSLTPKTYAHP